MTPSEVRKYILRDHDVLREELSSLERLAREILAGRAPEVDRLRDEGCSFHDTLARHMEWEDAHLKPILRDIDAWGEERARRLTEEHREQRELLSRSLENLRDPARDASFVARDVLALAEWLRRDMEGEEAQTLDPQVLRDDVVGIDVESG